MKGEVVNAGVVLDALPNAFSKCMIWAIGESVPDTFYHDVVAAQKDRFAFECAVVKFG
jgi:hypothetical protein